MKNVPTRLHDLAQMFQDKKQEYGNNYQDFGVFASRLMPSGMIIETPEDWNRAQVFIQMIVKLSRYANNYNKGGHDDSLSDLAVYSMMLQELDEDAIFQKEFRDEMHNIRHRDDGSNNEHGDAVGEST